MARDVYRIAYFVTALGLGGAEAQVYLLAREMKRRGNAVAVCYLLEKPNHFGPLLVRENVEVFCFPLSGVHWFPAAALAASRWIKAWRPDVVHSHMAHANIFTRILRIWTPIPCLVCSAHNSDEHSVFRAAAYRVTEKLADITTNVSPYAVLAYVNKGYATESALIYMPQIIDTAKFKQCPATRHKYRAVLGLGELYTFIAVGRLVPVKGFDLIVRALKEVQKKRGQCRLLIVGDGPEKHSIKKLAARLAVGSAVHFLGARDDVPALLNAADCLVMSSIDEGGPMVLLEALACGKAVITTAVGIGPSLADHPWVSIVARRDPLLFAEAMLSVANEAIEEYAVGQWLPDNEPSSVATMWMNVYTRGSSPTHK